MNYPNSDFLCKNTGCEVFVYDNIISTNDIAKTAAENGANDGTLFIAKNQSGGHGRGGKSFFCYEGGIYMSIIIRRSSLPAELITSAAAAAVCRAVRAATGVQTKIKWVNDIYKGDKKICGILTLHAGGAYIVGIGLNAENTVFPDDLRRTAAALGSGIDLNILAADIINKLRSAVCEDACSVIDYCRQYSYTLGKRVTYIKNEVLYKGFADCLNSDGSLSVLLDNGDYDVLNSGEVSVKPEKQ